jgi:hypothetical protein
MIDEDSGRNILKDFLSIKLMHFEHLDGAPTQVSNSSNNSNNNNNINVLIHHCIHILR